MTRSDFDISLRAGQEYEQFAYDLLTGLHGQYEVHPAVTIEVKDQHKAKTHVFIEDESWGKPGGIAVTKAEWWCLVIAPRTLLFIETERLRWLYQEAIRLFGRRRGGDENTAYGAIVPKEWLVTE